MNFYLWMYLAQEGEFEEAFEFVREKQQDPSPFETMLGMNPWNTVAFQDPPFDDFLFFYLGVVFEDAAPAVILE